MPERTKRRTFHAQLTPTGYSLHCRQCGTREDLGRDDLPHDIARVHARWFHEWGRPQIPPMGMIV